MEIRLKYFQHVPNAGDQFSKRLAQHYFSEQVLSFTGNPLAEPNLILLGSLLHWADHMSHICGTGLISDNHKLNAKPKQINCVRGPLTAEFLGKQGIEAPQIFGDPGILAPKIFPQTITSDFQLGIIPHYVDMKSPWVDYCRQLGVLIIDPLSSLTEYFEQLQRCKVILSSSLHGIIFAHAYEKPALWIELSDEIIGDGFKFFDYYRSIGIRPEKVTRIFVPERISPFELAMLATPGDQSKLIEPLETAISKTKQQLMG